MPMTIFKIIEFIGIFLSYTAVVLLLPTLMLRKILRDRSISEQFLMCYTFGNFFIINIVFILQLLHISNFATLALLTIGSSILIWSRVEKVSLKDKLKEYGYQNKKLMQRKLGLKTVHHRYMSAFFQKMRGVARSVYKGVMLKNVQWMFVLGIIVALMWIYGRQIILTYGYRASDIPVHMEWINEMSRGNLFSDGVYPFGFHCIVYYLHVFFRIDTYVILCQFFLVEVIYAHLVGLAVLKALCRSKYLPYAGILLYILGDFWAKQTYSRYYSSLPQEFGMIFVFPVIYFLIRFFQIKKEDLKEKETIYQLSCFAMAFALTLTIHFYGTMIAGIACVGIAFGFFFRFFRKEYFGRIMVTGVISIFLAVLPMGIAFATGTPLQGSLGWGMSVIQGNNGTQVSLEDDSTYEPIPSDESHKSSFDEEEREKIEEIIERYEQGEEAPTDIASEDTVSTGTKQEKKSIKDRLDSLLAIALGRVKEFILPMESENMGYFTLLCIAALFPLGMLHCIFRRREYGGMILSTCMYMLFIMVLLCSGELGLPTLMDPARCSIYFAYLLWSVPILVVDSLLYFVMPLNVLQIPRNGISLLLTGAILVGAFQDGEIKQVEFSSDYVKNEAIICLDNIIYENEDEKWTIVSANDELQMGLDHGWHYEIHSFLHGMEYLTSNTKIEIPTEKVYIFIEKIPVNYAVAYANSGQSISRKGASQELPNSAGLGNYAGENRWIEMSRMYYWAEAFQKMYPNEMQVYYETDEFICYKIEQNMYRLYNFAIDYGYNTIITEDS